MMSQPQAFLSYTRIDDEFYGGAITALRSALELGVQVVTGNRNFKIFQDVDGIELGQQWRERIEEALSEARFLIPIVTPLFFSSEACRGELAKFIAYEKKSERNDLILPIYFVTAPVLEKADQLAADPLAREISNRQRRDWRLQADLPVNDPKVRHEVRSLSEQIAGALDRTQKSTTAPLSPAQNSMRERQFIDNSEIVNNQVVNTRVQSRNDGLKLKTVLWVDDRPENNVYERAAMEQYSIRFVLSKSTEDALEKLSSADFDAVISDMGRPPDPRAGYTLLKAVRSRAIQTPYFIYAGSRAREHIAEARRRGAQGTTNVASELVQMVVDATRAGSSSSALTA